MTDARFLRATFCHGKVAGKVAGNFAETFWGACLNCGGNLGGCALTKQSPVHGEELQRATFYPNP
jgi:hypothetical protein